MWIIRRVDWGSLEIEFDPSDYPDFADAFAVSGLATDGSDLTEELLDLINDRCADMIQEMARERYGRN